MNPSYDVSSEKKATTPIRVIVLQHAGAAKHTGTLVAAHVFTIDNAYGLLEAQRSDGRIPLPSGSIPACGPV